MKRYIKFTITIFCLALTITGCKKFLDVNKDPNHPLAVSESLLLGPIIKSMAGNTVVGECGSAATYWTQQVSQNQPAPNLESYEINPEDVNNDWAFGLYPAIFENLKLMIGQAEAAHHNQYAAIGKALFAYNLAVTTDFWNDVPYSQALTPSISKPKYDSQESVYRAVQSLLDSALYYAKQPASVAAVPSTDDFIYGGDMGKWTKFIYMLKARYYMRLSVAPGHTASLQADSALTALNSGFADNSDNATIIYTGSANDQNPWYGGTQPGQTVALAKFFVDGLVNSKDPRLPVIANLNSAGGYSGRPSGADPAPVYTAFSTIGTFFGGVDPLNIDNVSGEGAPLIVATYSEALFIKAEATFIKQGAASAQPIYKAAIEANMTQLGISIAPSTTGANPTPAGAGEIYYNLLPPLTATNAEAQIISQKYVADFLSVEAYDDWRRTGFPVLALVQNAFVNYIPRRFPYPSAELTANPQPQQSATTKDHVWWDTRTN